MTRAQKLPPVPCVLPSIIELGRMLGAVVRQEARVDELRDALGRPASEEERRERASKSLRLDTADRLLFHRIDGLRDLISTMPAETLSDCVVQINIACHLIMKVTCNDLEKPELDELSDAIERITISVLPVLAAASGLDLAEFALDEITNLHEGRFPAVAA